MADVTVAQLWRFPVKSMGGGQVDSVRIDRRGVHADRLWAVRDVEKGVTASARRVPALLGCSARYLGEPADDAGPGNVPGVVITFPDGRELAHDDSAVNDALSELVGRELRLVALPPAEDKSQHRMTMQDSLANFAPAQVRKDFGLDDTEALPDTSVFSTKDVITLARYSTPPGTFVDLSPVHLLSTASLASLAGDGSPYDVRRFRPNVLVDATGDFPESAWVGGTADDRNGRAGRGDPDHPVRRAHAPATGNRAGQGHHPTARRADEPFPRGLCGRCGGRCGPRRRRRTGRTGDTAKCHAPHGLRSQQGGDAAGAAAAGGDRTA